MCDTRRVTHPAAVAIVNVSFFGAPLRIFPILPVPPFLASWALHLDDECRSELKSYEPKRATTPTVVSDDNDDDDDDDDGDDDVCLSHTVTMSLKMSLKMSLTMSLTMSLKMSITHTHLL